MIGAGMIARQHLEHLNNTERVRLGWIAARKPGNLEEVRAAYGVERKTHDYREILADPAVDAVYITTPPYLHAEMFEAAMEAGKHVLLEKPMAVSKEEVERILAAHRKHPELHAMDCSGRHARLSPKFRMVKALIDEGRLGEVYRIHHNHVVRQGRPGIEFHPAAKWFLDKSRAGGGPLFDWGVYDLSFHLGVLGDAYHLEEVEDVIMKRGLDEVDPGTDVYDVEEHFMIQLRLNKHVHYFWERGAHANMEVPNETRIYGSRGGIKLAYTTWDAPEIIFYDLDEAGKARKQLLAVDMSAHSHDGYMLSEHFLDVVEGKCRPVIDLETAARHMDILFRCSMFARS
ncbi:MAG: hypothetical protein CSA96_08955 [Bacteroidetes bacterium]|nr:MAG: hypothetical protein CSA96_08955 [Bacteroidota bacterium]